jgi:DNA polymerase-3 subunit delta
MPKQAFDPFFKAARKGEIPNAVYLHGPEDVLKEEVVTEIISRVLDPSLRDFNFDQRSALSLDPEQAETLCHTVPMMSDRRIVVIRDVEAWNKRARAKATILRYLERPASETILMLIQGSTESEVDDELAAKTVTVAVEPLAPDRCEKWVMHYAERLGVQLEEAAARHMVKVTDARLADLRSELDKLAGLGGGEPLTLDRVAASLGVRHGETQYDWREAVLRGESGKAVAMLPHLLSQTGVTGVGLVALLGTSVIGLGLARSYYDQGSRGPHLFQAIKGSLFRARPFRLSFDAAAAEWSRLAPSWPRARVERSLTALRTADLRLKNTTVSDERSVLFDLLMELSVPWLAAA